MPRLFLLADDVLRRRPGLVAAEKPAAVAALVALIACFGMAYGGTMGSFGGLAGERLLQVLFSALKVPLLLLLTFAICFSFFYVLNSLFGLRDDFGEAIRALIAAQAGLAVILASLAPLTAVWYLSSGVYEAATLFNAAMFAVASFGAQFVLRDFYRPLIARNPRHRTMLWIWLGVYAFVGIQMGWTLRPFVGDPHAPVQFFREDTWGNAYIELYRIVSDLLHSSSP